MLAFQGLADPYGTRAQVEIIEGLSAGEELVTAGQMKIFDGAKVKTVPAIGLDETGNQS